MKNRLDELRSAQDLVRALCEPLDENDLRAQFHPELSPLGWHLGHCAYTESYWLQEILQRDTRATAPLREIYTPALSPKAERGKKIPAPESLQHWVLEQQAINREILATPSSEVREHTLMQKDYLLHFLVQHYSQHYENMQMVLAQRALAQDPGDYVVKKLLSPQEPQTDFCTVDAGEYPVGGMAPLAYDNEVPAMQVSLESYRIARRPVVNAEYLAFMEAGGYTRQDLWSDAGWQWRQQQNLPAPLHWRNNAAGDWYAVSARGAQDLDAGTAVLGISQHEACAYARWAGGRLPHEHQWEVACYLQRLQDCGAVWEWCSNAFFPYEGFRPFPYNEYSQSWFDNRHYTLRGGSLHTRPVLKRPSFRNFYTADKRHIFAGLRLVL